MPACFCRRQPRFSGPRSRLLPAPRRPSPRGPRLGDSGLRDARAAQEERAKRRGRFLQPRRLVGHQPPRDDLVERAEPGDAWFGALNEGVARWLMADEPARLEETYPPLRALLLRSAGVPEARIAEPGPAR